jgi:hypothetical protein
LADNVVVVADMDHVVCELELCKSQKKESNGVIQCLRMKSNNKSRFSIFCVACLSSLLSVQSAK